MKINNIKKILSDISKYNSEELITELSKEKELIVSEVKLYNNITGYKFQAHHFTVIALDPCLSEPEKKATLEFLLHRLITNPNELCLCPRVLLGVSSIKNKNGTTIYDKKAPLPKGFNEVFGGGVVNTISSKFEGRECYV